MPESNSQKHGGDKGRSGVVAFLEPARCPDEFVTYLLTAVLVELLAVEVAEDSPEVDEEPGVGGRGEDSLATEGEEGNPPTNTPSLPVAVCLLEERRPLEREKRYGAASCLPPPLLLIFH